MYIYQLPPLLEYMYYTILPPSNIYHTIPYQLHYSHTKFKFVCVLIESIQDITQHKYTAKLCVYKGNNAIAVVQDPPEPHSRWFTLAYASLSVQGNIISDQ